MNHATDVVEVSTDERIELLEHRVKELEAALAFVGSFWVQRHHHTSD